MLSRSKVKGSSHDPFQGTYFRKYTEGLMKSIIICRRYPHWHWTEVSSKYEAILGFHHMKWAVNRQTSVLSAPLIESCASKFMFYNTVSYFLLFCLLQEFCTAKPGASTTTSEDWETEGGVWTIFVHTNSFWLLGKKECCDKQ